MNRYLLYIVFSLLLFGRPAIGTVQAQNIVRLSDRTITVRGEQYLIHKVKKGETLYMIAKAYAVSQEEIMKANSLTRDVLRNKQTLLIPQHDPQRKRGGTTQATAPVQVPTTTAGQPQRQSEEQRNEMQKESERAYTQGKWNIRKPSEQETIQPVDSTPLVIVPEPMVEELNGRLKPIDRTRALDVAVLLPIQPGLKTNRRFSEFYKGMLLGLNALKAEGISAQVRCLNSGASEAKAQELIRGGKLDHADLIVGPVYAAAFEPVATFAATRGIPVVSPLGTVGCERNPYVFEAAPDDESAYRYIFEQFSGRAGTKSEGANFVLIDHVEYPDTATVALIEQQLGDRVATLSFTSQRSQTQTMERWLTAALDRRLHNIVYVPVNRADALEGVLSHLSSINILGKYRITVIGTPRWEWISNINLDLFYKLDVHYPASYHADRSNPTVAEFYRTYMDMFGELPSPYAFRGYDVIRYFIGALNRFGSEMPERITGGKYRPELLQVEYDFRQNERGTKYRNTLWPVVNYKQDYTIEIVR